ncbi:putative nucleic acid-binding Zn-ribbon protein [Bradyrhizobium japonicum]|uniref:hypothetical protein n=1 Tax=Bradyrhizobium japonicum TaxID=375 RepID=UPI003392B6FA
MNIAERAGGVGVAIMMHKTSYEIEIDNLVELHQKLSFLIDQQQEQIRRRQQHVAKLSTRCDGVLAGCDELLAGLSGQFSKNATRDMKKSFTELAKSWATVNAEMDHSAALTEEIIATSAEIMATQVKISQAHKRREAALPEFRMWASLTQRSEPAPQSFGIADKASDANKGDRALSPLPKPTTAPIDPSSAVGDAVLRHRPDTRSF